MTDKNDAGEVHTAEEHTAEKHTAEEHISLDKLVSLLQSGPNLGLHRVLRDSLQAAKEITAKYQQIQEVYVSIKNDLKNLDVDKAYNCVELAHRNLEDFLHKKIPADYRTGILRTEEREKLSILRRAKKALSEKKELFYVWLGSIAQLEQTGTQEYIDKNDARHVVWKEKKEMVYFKKFIVDVLDDPLRQAMVILKQEEMYLPEAQLLARLPLDIAPPRDKGVIKSLLHQQKKEKKENYDYLAIKELFPFENDDSYYFLTGTHCTIGKNITLRNYLRYDPHSSVLINTSHAPKIVGKNEVSQDTPLIGNIPYLWPGKEKPALYGALIGREIDKFHRLQYTLKQGMVVMRSRDLGNKSGFEVKIQNPQHIEARFFYGATTNKEKIVAYLLGGSEEIDKECGVEFAGL